MKVEKSKTLVRSARRSVLGQAFDLFRCEPTQRAETLLSVRRLRS